MSISRKRKWKSNDIRKIVRESTSYRQVIFRLGLVPAGGNYEQVKKELVNRFIN